MILYPRYIQAHRHRSFVFNVCAVDARTRTHPHTRARAHTHTHKHKHKHKHKHTDAYTKRGPTKHASALSCCCRLPPPERHDTCTLCFPSPLPLLSGPCPFSLSPDPPPPAAYLPGLQAAASPAPSLPCSLPRPLPNNILADSQQKAHGRAIAAGTMLRLPRSDGSSVWRMTGNVGSKGGCCRQFVHVHLS